MDKNYDDIINLPHYISKKHPQMSIEARSAQFAPFSALTGYDEAIKETARLTDKRIEIDDGLKVVLNNKLQYILENLKLKPEIILTYFVYDDKKIGGKYVEKIGIVKKIDMVEQYVMLIDKTKIPVLEIINITGEIFNSMEE
ncbi:MAG: hypothetical protein IJN03_03395 [Bacilli bacterium]|nr:hypothetical protein [Bacilli bacterium]MBQ9853894.1 hypothetical protein [Bacilli bacterium]